jgi:hypothetical protein
MNSLRQSGTKSFSMVAVVSKRNFNQPELFGSCDEPWPKNVVVLGCVVDRIV